MKIYSIAAWPTLSLHLSPENARYMLVEHADCKQAAIVFLGNTHTLYPVTPTPLIRLKTAVLPNDISNGTVVFTSDFSSIMQHKPYVENAAMIARTVAPIKHNRATEKCLPLAGVDYATREPATATTQHNFIHAMKRYQKLFSFSVLSTEHGDAKMKGFHLKTVKVMHPLCSAVCQAHA